jgi:phosphoribosylanthranilate isomerase
MKPYVGITGFKTIDEINAVAEAAQDLHVMYGLLAADWNLQEPHRESTRNPPANRLRELVAAVPEHGLPMIHYCNHHTNSVYEPVKRLFDLSGARAAQLNMHWPDIKQVEALKKETDFTFTLQIEESCVQDNLYENASKYKDVADYVLVDLSMGRGKDFDPAESDKLLDIMQRALPHTTLGVAGGLSAENLASQLGALEHKGLMYDAEGKLFGPHSLDMGACEAYISVAKQLR